MTRQPLPNARPNVTVDVHWNGHVFPVTIGFTWPDMRPAECFADVAKGGQMQWIVADACVLISIALQHGIDPTELAKSLGRVPVLWAEGETQPASPLGAIVEAIMAEANT
jgi:hypothetical protein